MFIAQLAQIVPEYAHSSPTNVCLQGSFPQSLHQPPLLSELFFYSSNLYLNIYGIPFFPCNVFIFRYESGVWILYKSS